MIRLRKNCDRCATERLYSLPSNWKRRLLACILLATEKVPALLSSFSKFSHPFRSARHWLGQSRTTNCTTTKFTKRIDESHAF